MIICSRPKIAYFAPSKTGTTTVEKTFKELGFDITVGRALKHDIWPPEKIAPLVEQGYFFMATVRNPYSRVVSMWSHFQKKSTTLFKKLPKDQFVLRSEITEVSEPLDFRDWVYRVLVDEYFSSRFASYLSNQADYLAAMPRQDALLRQELLSSDLLKLPFIKELGIKTITPKRRGTYRGKGHWKTFYQGDSDLIATVKSRFEADFDAAQYTTDFERSI
jgi:hypothetical protein